MKSEVFVTLEPDAEDKLTQCMGQEGKTSLFSIGHRGAPIQFPEHTVESNAAAARMYTGILECDVTFSLARKQFI